MGTPKTKTIKMRKYRITWTTEFGGMVRILTLRARNKQEAVRLVADRYPARKKHVASLVKTA